MRNIVLDADAFRCLRELELLRPLLHATASIASTTLTEYVARHELNLVDAEVRGLEAAGLLRVAPIVVGTPAAARFRAFQKRGIDKGESEILAWALERTPGERCVFITADRRAARLAKDEKLPVTDVFGVLIVAIADGNLDPTGVKEAAEFWDDPHASRCRPDQWRGFSREFEARIETERARFSRDPR